MQPALVPIGYSAPSNPGVRFSAPARWLLPIPFFLIPSVGCFLIPGPYSLLRPRLALKLSRPRQKSQQFPTLGPHESEHRTRRQCLGFLARVGLDAPAQKLAPPRSQPVAPRRIPQKPQRSKQGESSCPQYREGEAAAPVKVTGQTEGCGLQPARMPGKCSGSGWRVRASAEGYGLQPVQVSSKQDGALQPAEKPSDLKGHEFTRAVNAAN